MHLKIQIEDTPRHSDVATCTTWNSLDEVFSCGDDHKLYLWNISKPEIKKVLDLPEDLYPITIAWPPKGPVIIGSNKKNFEVLLITASDGRLYLMGRGGRMEKVVQAHTGAILSASWNPDGSELLTSGEDGSVRIWSRTGSLRTTLAQLSIPIYTSAWSPDGRRLVYSSGSNLVVKSSLANSNARFLEWEAHAGLILCVSWSTNWNQIISGGEDCKYKLWSADGANLFTSITFNHPITSVQWSPAGSVFAVGSFRMLRLCSRHGWSHYHEEDVDVGSIYNIQWSTDSTQFTCACANGQIILATLINDITVWRNYEACLETAHSITIAHYNKNIRDRLDFRERVIKVYLNFGYMIVVTLTKVYVYHVEHIATPANCDVQEHGIGAVSFITQTPKTFAVIGGNLITIWSYKGNKTATIKYSSLRTHFLNPDLITLTADLLAIVDQVDPKQIFLFDPNSGSSGGAGGGGKPLGVIELAATPTPTAASPIQQITFAQHDYFRLGERLLAIIDSSEDLYIAFIRRSTNLLIEGPLKLDSGVRGGIWHNEACILAVLRDVKLRIFYLPQVLYMDMALVDETMEDKDLGELGKICQLLTYDVNRIELCKTDGTVVNAVGNPFIAHIQSNGFNGKLDKAQRIARYVNNKLVWAVFGTLALWKGELELAEIAFAEIGQNDKVLFIQAVQEVGDPVSKKAQIQLLRGRLADAEAILLNAGRIGESINIHIQTHNWDRALELALKSKENLPPLFEARAAFLINMKLKAEYLQSFIDVGKQLKQLMTAGKKNKKNIDQQQVPPAAATTNTTRQKPNKVTDDKENDNNVIIPVPVIMKHPARKDTAKAEEEEEFGESRELLQNGNENEEEIIEQIELQEDF